MLPIPNPRKSEKYNSCIKQINDSEFTQKQTKYSRNINQCKRSIISSMNGSVSHCLNMNFTPEVFMWNGMTCDLDIGLNVTSSMSQVLLPATPSSGATVDDQNGGNGTETELNSFYFYEIEQFTVLWILFTVIVLGNSAVLVTLILNKHQKSRMNFFIKQLAIADLSVGLLNVLTDICWRLTVSWRAGNVACKLIRFMQAGVTYASTYVLVALSIDRYDAITHPMNFSGSWRRARRLVAAAWALSAIFSIPMIFLYEERPIQGQTQCWIELGAPWRWQLYMTLVSTALFAFPALIISACYAVIVRTIWAKGRTLAPSHGERMGCSNDSGSRRASSRGIIPRAKVKTVKMTIVIVIVFVMCWSPYIVFDLLQVFGKVPRTQTNIAVASFIQSLAPLNSAANPLIYCLFSTHLCRTIRRIPPFSWLCPGTMCDTPARCGPPHTRRHCGTINNNSNESLRTMTTSLSASQHSRRATRTSALVANHEHPLRTTKVTISVV